MILLKKHFLFSSLLFILIGLGGLAAQDPTVGLIYNSPGAFPGYTLFTSLTNTGIFLIDNCGKVVHKWQDDKTVANWMYLRKDGSLVRTAKSRSVNSSIFHGGGGELVQILDWEGNVTWEYSYANDSVRLHHDIALLPNGNILMLAWENFSDQEAIGQGRDPDLLSSGFLSPEHIIEVQPVGQDSGTIVWEWHVWDHLIQDFDSTKPNYGVVADHPELFDLNYINPFLSLQYASGGDWMHANSVSYNLELDQIMLSLQRWNELIIIDHSTTREEAASHTGGRYGKGGISFIVMETRMPPGSGSLKKQYFGDSIIFPGYLKGFREPGNLFFSTTVRGGIPVIQRFYRLILRNLLRGYIYRKPEPILVLQNRNICMGARTPLSFIPPLFP